MPKTTMYLVMGKVKGIDKRADFRAESNEQAQKKFVQYMMKKFDTSESEITEVKSMIRPRGVK